LAVAILTGILNGLLVLTSLFLICLILIQRGKGGGLAGAFGGMGGSSAFGTKAGDVFTRVTIYVALFWGFLAMVLVYQSNRGSSSAWHEDTAVSSKVARESASQTGPGTNKVKTGASEPKASGSRPSTPLGSPSSAPAPVDVPALPDESSSSSKPAQKAK
jgi:preprotein translocase subunit SecG